MIGVHGENYGQQNGKPLSSYHHPEHKRDDEYDISKTVVWEDKAQCKNKSKIVFFQYNIKKPHLTFSFNPFLYANFCSINLIVCDMYLYRQLVMESTCLQCNSHDQFIM